MALPGGGFCCTVNAPPAILPTSPGAAVGVWPEALEADLWLSLAQDGGPGGAMAEADTWEYAGCWGSSN